MFWTITFFKTKTVKEQTNKQKSNYIYSVILKFPVFINPCKSMSGNHLVGLFNPTSLTFNKIPTHVLYPTIIDLFLITCFKILPQNWMAFTNLRVDNFTITDSLVFTNTNSPSPQDNYAFCQVRIKSASFLHNVTDTLQKFGFMKSAQLRQFIFIFPFSSESCADLETKQFNLLLQRFA